MPNPGILDFQDAVIGPISYDVVSLFKDAFVSWPEEQVLDWTIRYWEKARRAGLPVDDDFHAFFRAFEWMGLQRHLKVLGIFARIAHRDGKPGYLEDTPRFIAYARPVAQRYRELAPLARLLDRLDSSRHSRRRTCLADELSPPARTRRLMTGAMILAAGRGERMRPLSDTTPKPLLKVARQAADRLADRALARAGIRDIAINVSHLADRMIDAIGDGRAHGVTIHWSREAEPLETAGGIATAMPLLPDGPAIIVSGDIWTTYDYAATAPACRGDAA